MSAIDYSHLVELYRKCGDRLELFHESVQHDHGYYCGTGKSPPAKAEAHALFVAQEQLRTWRAKPGRYTVTVYRVPADAQVPVPKEHRALVIATNLIRPNES